MLCQNNILVGKNQLFLQNFKKRQAKTNSMLSHRLFEYFCFQRNRKTIYHIMVANNFTQKCNKFPNKTVKQLRWNSLVVLQKLKDVDLVYRSFTEQYTKTTNLCICFCSLYIQLHIHNHQTLQMFHCNNTS